MMTAVNEANFKQFNGGQTPIFIYEDEQCVVFDEVLKPQAPVHFLVVPRKMIPRMTLCTEDEEKMLGHMLLVARNIALQKGLGNEGYHVVVDEDHRKVRFKAIHVFGRALHHMIWPVGPGARL